MIIDNKCEWLTDIIPMKESFIIEVKMWQTCTRGTCTCKDIPGLAKQTRQCLDRITYSNREYKPNSYEDRG